MSLPHRYSFNCVITAIAISEYFLRLPILYSRDSRAAGAVVSLRASCVRQYSTRVATINWLSPYLVFSLSRHDSCVKLTQNTPRGGNTSCVPQLYIYIISKIFKKIKLGTKAREKEILIYFKKSPISLKLFCPKIFFTCGQPLASWAAAYPCYRHSLEHTSS